MKLIILTFSILFLASCQQYQYDVTYEKCNGQTGSTILHNIPRYAVEGNRWWYPDKSVSTNSNDALITDVCDFSYNRNPIE